MRPLVLRRLSLLATAFVLACSGGSQTTVGTQTAPKTAPPPVGISRLQPSRGPATGGTVVVLRGYNFTPTMKVSVGGTAAPEVTVTDGQTASFTTPAGKNGDVDVVVTNSDGGTATFAKGFTYADPGAGDPPALAKVTPNSGPTIGGTVALLEGTGFVDGAVVVIGGRPARAATFVSATQMTAVLPEGPVGTAKVAVSNPDGRTALLLGAFAYFDPASAGKAPLLSGLAPADGPSAGGQTVTVTGSNFADGVLAYLGGFPIALASHTDTTLTFVTPSMHPGTYAFAVTNPDGQSAVEDGAYVFFAPPPAVLGVNPAYGDATQATQVSISGRFFQAGAVVKVGGKAVANATVSSDETIVATFPPVTAGGPVDITVENPDGLAGALTAGFTYTDASHPKPQAALGLTRIVPATGSSAGGTLVSAAGLGFVSGISVTVGGTSATNVAVRSPNQLVFTTPAGQVGPADVTVQLPTGERATLARAFFFFDAGSTSAAPRLTQVIPASGPTDGGSIVSLAGTGFATSSRVFFGAAEARSVTFVSATQLTVETPAGGAGPVDVAVVNPDGKTALLPAGFAYLGGGSGTGPSITAVDPATGSVSTGAKVTVTGTNFDPALVAFADGVSVTPGDLSATSFTLQLPPHAAGSIDLVVTNPDGRSARAPGAFTYEQLAPGLDSIAPAVGPLSGGIEAVVSGHDFAAGATAFVGGLSAATDVLDDHTLRVAIPASSGTATAQVDVTVVNPDGQRATLTGGFTYSTDVNLGDAPVLTALTPAKGPATGGTKLVVKGDHFAEGMMALVGGKTATLTVIDAQTATLTTPAGAVGPVDVVVTNPDGQYASLLDGFLYLDPANMAAAPALSGVTPDHGPQTKSTPVYVTGSRLQSGAIVFFGELPALNPLFVHSGLYRCSAPPAPAPGKVPVSITNPDGQTVTIPGGFFYAAPPVLTGATPSSGPAVGGTHVVLDGSGFRDGVLVSFGANRSSSVTVLSGTILDAVTPPGAAGVVDVTLTDIDGQVAKLPAAFTYVPAPTISGLQPATGPQGGGTVLVLTGANFTPGVTVTVGGVAASVDSITPDTLIVTTAAGNAGAQDVVVTNLDGQNAKAAGGFTYVPNAQLGAPPQLNAIAPVQGPATGGTVAAFFGAKIQAKAIFIVGARPVTKVKIVDQATASGVVPAGTVGKTRVVVTNPDGQSAILPDGFTYLDPALLPPAPLVTSAAPPTGSTFGGDTSVAKGANFTAGSFVLLGGVPEDSTFAGPSSVSFVAAAQPIGQVDLTVTTGEGQSVTLPNGFAFVVPAPLISDVQPRTGPAIGGTTLTVTGKNFQGGLTVTINGKPVRNLAVQGPGQLTFDTPDNPDGPAAIVVTNPDGKSVTLPGAPDGFSYIAAPSVSQVQPASGPTSGGTSITITGTYFRSGATVAIGGKPALNVKFVSGAAITATTPVAGAGPAAVVVTNPDGQIGNLTAGFTYVAPVPGPTLTNLSPNFGSITGGTAVVITGSNFQAGATVQFGTANATNVVLLSPTAIACNTPGNVAAQVNVTVTNPDGQSAALAKAYTYVPDAALPPLALVTIAPTLGGVTGGTQVTIMGRGIMNGATATFGGVAATQVTWLGPTALSVLTPAHAAGPVDVTVTNPDGQTATLTKGYTFGTPGRFVLAPQRMPLESQGYKDKAYLFDYDNDGDSDLLITSNNYSVRPWLYRNDKGSFVDVSATAFAAWGSPCCGTPYDALIGDFDNDGDQDIIFIYDWRNLQFAKNDGGTFSFPGGRFNNPTNAGYTYTSGATGDLNGDGKLDFVLGVYNDVEVVAINRPSSPGTFDLAYFPSGQGVADLTYGIALGDVDGDGDLDCFTANANDQQKQLYLNDGTGKFTRTIPGTNFPVAAGNSRTVLMRDFNGDKKVDILVGNYGQQDRLYLNNGSGVFTDVSGSHMPVDADNTFRTYSVDVDRDGDLDLLTLRDNTPASGQRERLYLNDGAGNFSDVTTGNWPKGLREGTVAIAVPRNANPFTLNTAAEAVQMDVDADGAVDALEINYAAQNRILASGTGARAGQFQYATTTAIPEENDSVPGGSAMPKAVDLDGDGDIDLVKPIAGAPLKLLFNDGAGNLVDLSAGRIPKIALNPMSMLVFDTNADGAPDIMVFQSNAPTYLFINDGTGSFKDASATLLPVSTRTAMDNGAAEVIDVDRDGAPDVVMNWSYYGNGFRLWRNVQGSFLDVQTGVTNFSNGYGWYPRSIVAGDFDGDGWTDLVTARAGANALLFNVPGTWSFADKVATNMPSPSDGKRPIVADLDGDKDLDVFFVNYGSDRLRLNNGNGVLADLTASNLPGQISQSCDGALVDVNGDTLPDIVIAKNDNCDGGNSFGFNPSGQQVRLLLNMGAGTFVDGTNGRLPASDDNNMGVVSADFDGDGHKDFWISNNGQSRLYFWRP